MMINTNRDIQSQVLVSDALSSLWNMFLNISVGVDLLK